MEGGDEEGLLDGFLAQLLFCRDRHLLELDEEEVVGGSPSSDSGEMIEPEDGFWGLAEAVFQLVEDFVGISETHCFSKSVVDLEAQRTIVDVGVWNTGIEGEFHLGFEEGGGLLLFHPVDGALEELAVEVETD